MTNPAVTPRSFADSLLSALGDPITPQNELAIAAWEAAEGGNWHNNATANPLNTTQDEPGATSINSAGVKAYTSWSQGLDATVQTLNNGRYGGILSALSAGNSAQAVGQAVQASPWGTGGGVLKVLNSLKSSGHGFSLTDAALIGASALPGVGALPALIGAGAAAGSAAGTGNPITGAASAVTGAAGKWGWSMVGGSVTHGALLIVGLLAGAGLVVLGVNRATGDHMHAPSVVPLPV